jgi:2-polyprenyl-3-methyl-5-hydroxy-6-metoxy-1,4-benzoquinol methylase
MTPEDIGKAYDQITHRWEHKDFNRDNGIAAHKHALSFLANKQRALDVGCGCTGRFIDLLENQGFTVEGVDISKEMLRLAKQKHPKVTFHHQDICSWDINDKYDFITAWDSIWHIPLTEQKNVISKLVNSLTKNGVLIFSFGGTAEAGEHTNTTMGPEVYYSSLGTTGVLKLLTELDCICKHLEYDQHPEVHTYIVVQKTS